MEVSLCEQTTSNQGAKDSALFVQKKDAPKLLKDKVQSPKVCKKKSKKGGLSMFLSGALDDTPKEATPPPPAPRNEGPAWGGAKLLKGSSSLREIQVEQSRTKENHAARNKDQQGQGEDISDGISSNSGRKIQLSSLFPSSPISVVSTHSPHASDGERSTPPWAASGTPPHPSRPSLRDIQVQQVCEIMYPPVLCFFFVNYC